MFLLLLWKRKYSHMKTGQRGIFTINRTRWTRASANTEILLHTLEGMMPSRTVGNIYYDVEVDFITMKSCNCVHIANFKKKLTEKYLKENN